MTVPPLPVWLCSAFRTSLCSAELAIRGYASNFILCGWNWGATRSHGVLGRSITPHFSMARRNSLFSGFFAYSMMS